MVLVCSILLLVAVTGLFFNAMYKHTNAYCNQFIDIDKFKYLSGQPDHSIDVAVLGSNAPKFAFDFSEIKHLKCENWAVGPETFEYDFILLRKFAHKLKYGATVVWPICPGNFFLYKFLNQSDLTKYYRILSQDEFPEYSKQQYIKEYKYPLFYHPKRIKYLIKDIPQDLRMNLYKNLLDVEGVKKDAKWWIYNCWNPEFDIDIENMQPLSECNRRAVEENVRIVREMAQYCKDNGFRLLTVYLPLTKELGSLFSSMYVESQMTAYVKLATENYNVDLVDYMRDERFQSSDYYINSFFMNRKGAMIFTKTFVEENIIN